MFVPKPGILNHAFHLKRQLACCPTWQRLLGDSRSLSSIGLHEVDFEEIGLPSAVITLEPGWRRDREAESSGNYSVSGTLVLSLYLVVPKVWDWDNGERATIETRQDALAWTLWIMGQLTKEIEDLSQQDIPAHLPQVGDESFLTIAADETEVEPFIWEEERPFDVKELNVYSDGYIDGWITQVAQLFEVRI